MNTCRDSRTKSSVLGGATDEHARKQTDRQADDPESSAEHKNTDRLRKKKKKSVFSEQVVDATFEEKEGEKEEIPRAQIHLES